MKIFNKLRYGKISLFLVILVIIISCKSPDDKNYFLLENDMKKIISDYIETHNEFNTFILKDMSGQIFIEKDNDKMNRGFLLGPVYHNMINDNHSVYFVLLDKRIYYFSNLSLIIRSKQDNWKIKDVSDSTIINGIIIKNPWVLSMNKSIYLYFTDEKKISINYRPDTIFMPKPFDSVSVNFENILN